MCEAAVRETGVDGANQILTEECVALPEVGRPAGLFDHNGKPLLALEVVNICPELMVAVPAPPDAEDKTSSKISIRPFGENSVYLILAEQEQDRQVACLVVLTPETQSAWFSEPGAPGARFMPIWVSGPDGFGERSAISLTQEHVVLLPALLPYKPDVLMIIRSKIEQTLDEWRQLYSGQKSQVAA